MLPGNRKGPTRERFRRACSRTLGCSMVIVGHSERRHIFGEDNAMVNHRLLAALDAGLVPVLCIGETVDERESRSHICRFWKRSCARDWKMYSDQFRQNRWCLPMNRSGPLAPARQLPHNRPRRVHHFLRQLLAGLYDKKVAEAVRVLYGGSVKPDNIDELMAQPDIDGALVGGAALNADSFARIVHFT
jgi:triosephosphate isomerase (TIM)